MRRMGHSIGWEILGLAIWLLSWILTPLQAQARTDTPPPGTIPTVHRTYLPLLLSAAGVDAAECPLTSARTYNMVPVDGPPADHPDVLHADLNLALRGYVPVDAHLGLVDINGSADPDAPQMGGIFLDSRIPTFTSAHRIYEWDWSCGEHGCRSNQLTTREVTLLGMATSPGEPLSLPARSPRIYPDNLIALVLYAEKTRITLGYTRHDSVAPGYAVHMEQVCVDPALLALYQEANQQGRGHLPALRAGEILGTAMTTEIRVAIRDRGTFMDPRSRKDWWHGYR